MKVSELISKLQKCKADKEVLYITYEGESVEVRQVVEFKNVVDLF